MNSEKRRGTQENNATDFSLQPSIPILTVRKESDFNNGDGSFFVNWLIRMKCVSKIECFTVLDLGLSNTKVALPLIIDVPYFVKLFQSVV